MATNCLGGTGATLQVVNTDCGCVSISSISQAQNGLTFTITLDNGQSITLTLPTAPPADAIVPEFRASGTLLQYSVDGGTTWTTIYDLADADGVTILYNEFSGAVTIFNQ